MKKNTLGEIIYSLRKKAGMTQEDLADGICSTVSISRIENGNQMPSGKVLEKLLERLGTGTYQLCNIYYENEYQEKIHKSLEEIEALVSDGDLTSAKSALEKICEEEMDVTNLQHKKMIDAAIDIHEGRAGDDIEKDLLDALLLTKPKIKLEDFRGELLSPTEVNILVMLVTANHMAEKNIEAIRIGEETMFALSRNQSRLSDYKVMSINLAHNLGQILLEECRYKEALIYEKKAEELSIKGMEQFMLPEIEFGIAQILYCMGQKDESRDIMRAIMPYMRLIGKKDMADLVAEYIDENNIE